MERELGEAAPLAERNAFPQGDERGLLWPLVRPDEAGEVVLDHSGFAAQALLERELERPAYVLDAVCVRQRAAGEATEVERECRLGESEVGGKRECPVGSRDCLAVTAGQLAISGQVGVGADELRPGRLRLEQFDCLGDRALASSVAETEERQRKAGQDAVPREFVSIRWTPSASRIHRSGWSPGSSRVNTIAPLPSGAHAGRASATRLTVRRCSAPPAAGTVHSSTAWYAAPDSFAAPRVPARTRAAARRATMPAPSRTPRCS